MRNPYTCQSHLTPRVQAAKSSEKSAGDKDKDLNFEIKLRSWTTRFALIALRLNYYLEVSKCYSYHFIFLFFIIQCIYIVFCASTQRLL